MLTITTPSRLHLTLIDMNASIGRVDGSIGLTLNKPFIRIYADKSERIEIKGRSEHADRMRATALKLLPEDAGICITIENDYPSHTGMGSGTQASLAAGMAVNTLYGIGMDVYEVAAKTGRGGTSGIGVAAFEQGGFILDCGHKFTEKKAFLPSAASNLAPAPVILRRDFPDWELLIAVPESKGASSEKEMNIFQKECPVALADVEKLSHIILMQLLPALVEEDMETFGIAINSIQNVGFKKKEVELQPDSAKLAQALRDAGAYGAGMSSFGPAVYAFGEDVKELYKLAKEHLCGKGYVIITKARNEGALIDLKN